MRPGISFYRTILLVEKFVMGQLTSVDATLLLECAIHEAMPDAEAAITQSSTLCKGQSITDGKVLEKGTVFKAVRSFTFKAVWFSRFLLFLLSRAMILLGA